MTASFRDPRNARAKALALRIGEILEGEDPKTAMVALSVVMAAAFRDVDKRKTPEECARLAFQLVAEAMRGFQK